MQARRQALPLPNRAPPHFSTAMEKEQNRTDFCPATAHHVSIPRFMVYIAIVVVLLAVVCLLILREWNGLPPKHRR
jgi:hypothetical protein